MHMWTFDWPFRTLSFVMAIVHICISIQKKTHHIFSWFWIAFVSCAQVTTCDSSSTYRKAPVVGRLDFELWGYKAKISQNQFHIFWNLPYLIFKLQIKRFGAKTVWSCKNGPLNCQNSNTFFSKSLFLKINCSPIFYNILNETAISQEHNVRFQKFLHQNWADRTAI